MKKIIFSAVVYFLISSALCSESYSKSYSELYPENSSPSRDTLVSKDSSHNNKSMFGNTNTETERIFDDSQLADPEVRAIFNELFTQYLEIKDALVYNDSFGAVRNTLKLLDDMKSKTRDSETLNKDFRWLLFINNFDNIRNKVESTTFIKEQRFMFNEITTGLSELIKQFGLTNKTIYFMECNDESSGSQGKWFSDTRDKNNPYLGVINDTACAKVKEVWRF